MDVIVVDVFKSGGKIKHAVLPTKEILKYRMVTVPPFTVKTIIQLYAPDRAYEEHSILTLDVY